MKRNNLDDVFDMVTDDNGRTYVQCTHCGGYAKAWDDLALSVFVDRPFAKIRIALLTLPACAGFVKFAAKHSGCIRTIQGA